MATKKKGKQGMNTRRKTGFTVVELLIVVVVVAILAAISIVAYNGMQGRARDAQRMQDMATIMKALEVYRVQTGTYPTAVGTLNASGWETSTDGTSATNFLSMLTGLNGVSKIPVDPTNKGDSSGVPASLNPSRGNTNFMYYYHFYPAGTNGCDSARGAFYILGVTRMDTVAVNTNAPDSPGFSCSGMNWNLSGAWVTGKYING